MQSTERQVTLRYYVCGSVEMLPWSAFQSQRFSISRSSFVNFLERSSVRKLHWRFGRHRGCLGGVCWREGVCFSEGLQHGPCLWFIFCCWRWWPLCCHIPLPHLADVDAIREVESGSSLRKVPSKPPPDFKSFEEERWNSRLLHSKVLYFISWPQLHLCKTGIVFM